MTEQTVTFEYQGEQMTVSARICKGFLGKAIGKMFSFDRMPLLFAFSREQEVGIHMLFVFMPLLVVWLDEDLKPVKTKVMKPFVSTGTGRAKYVLEIPL